MLPLLSKNKSAELPGSNVPVKGGLPWQAKVAVNVAVCNGSESRTLSYGTDSYSTTTGLLHFPACTNVSLMRTAQWVGQILPVAYVAYQCV